MWIAPRVVLFLLTPAANEGPNGKPMSSSAERGRRRQVRYAMSGPPKPGRGTGVFPTTRADVRQRTLRTDRWWLPTLWTNLGFAAFVIYATMRSLMGENYWVPEYHSTETRSAAAKTRSTTWSLESIADIESLVIDSQWNSRPPVG